MSTAIRPHFLLTELIPKFGPSAAEYIDIRTHRFAVVVDGAEFGRFSNLPCAESTANEHYAQINELCRHEGMEADAGKRIKIVNSVNGVTYRRAPSSFWEVAAK